MSTKTTIIICAVIVVLFGALFWFSKNSNKIEMTTTILPTDWLRGPENPKVTIIEYGDFQCPACGSYEPILLKLQTEFKDTLAFSFRQFPLAQVHQNALLSAEASEAAGIQNKFWQMHDTLYQNQEEWSTNSKAREIFIGYAEKIGMDVSKFEKDMDSKEVSDKVKDSFEKGLKMGINSTPTFFVNGKKITNPRSYEDFKKLIEDTIKASATTTPTQ